MGYGSSRSSTETSPFIWRRSKHIRAARWSFVTRCEDIVRLHENAASPLLRWPAKPRFGQIDRSEFVVAIAAFAGVLTFGLLRGVMLGALISLVQLVRVSSRPHVAL